MINIPLCSFLLYTVSSVYACINNTNKFNPQLCVLQLMACDFLEAQHMIVYFSSFVSCFLDKCLISIPSIPQVHDYYNQALQFLESQGPSYVGSRKAKVDVQYICHR